MSGTVWYGDLVWDCPTEGCNTSPCGFCKKKMKEIDGTLQIPLIIPKEERRKEYFPFLEP